VISFERFGSPCEVSLDSKFRAESVLIVARSQATRFSRPGEERHESKMDSVLGTLVVKTHDTNCYYRASTSYSRPSTSYSRPSDGKQIAKSMHT
jgi:hypothetical protein